MSQNIVPHSDMHVIAPVGMIASGKDHIAGVINTEYGIPNGTISDILRKIALDEGKNPGDRQTLIDISSRLTRGSGGDGAVLAKEYIKKAQAEGIKELSITGMRQSPQMAYLMNTIGRMTSIFLHTHNNIRYARYVGSKPSRGEPVMSYDEFIRAEIEQNAFHQGDPRLSEENPGSVYSKNDLYNLASLCRYHWLPDGSVIDTGVKLEMPTMNPYCVTEEHKVLLSQNPDALRELLGGETIIVPIPELLTPESHQAMNDVIKNDPNGVIAKENHRRTRATVRLILGHSRVGHDYLEGYARLRQDSE